MHALNDTSSYAFFHGRRVRVYEIRQAACNGHAILTTHLLTVTCPADRVTLLDLSSSRPTLRAFPLCLPVKRRNNALCVCVSLSLRRRQAQRKESFPPPPLS
jgi:hypothetical protein